MKITSLESLDAHVAEACRLKLQLAADTAQMEARIAEIQKMHAAGQAALKKDIANLEADVMAYCEANRSLIFTNRKSRETASACFGFELTPHRVETASRKIKWADVVTRLLRLSWGKAYIRLADPKPDKEALLSDREKLSPEQLTAAGIQFCQDEQFFIRPKSNVAEATVQAAA